MNRRRGTARQIANAFIAEGLIKPKGDQGKAAQQKSAAKAATTTSPAPSTSPSPAPSLIKQDVKQYCPFSDDDMPLRPPSILSGRRSKMEHVLTVPVAEVDLTVVTEPPDIIMAEEDTAIYKGGKFAFKKIFLKRKKSSVRQKEKKIRQNRQLRKALFPKNALMALNEVKGVSISDFIINNSPTGGFHAVVTVNTVAYEGRGTTKMGAKNNACEKALRDYVIAKMRKKPRLPRLSGGSVPSNKVPAAGAGASVDAASAGAANAGAASADVNAGANAGVSADASADASAGAGASADASADASAGAASAAGASAGEAIDTDSNCGDDIDEVPMINLASFAIFKLFTEWESDGFLIPEMHPSTVCTTKSDGEPMVKEQKPQHVRTELPKNWEAMHPATLLCMMRPGLAYTDNGPVGEKPNVLQSVTVSTDDHDFTATGRSKKLARRNAAAAVCNKLFNTNFGQDEN